MCAVAESIRNFPKEHRSALFSSPLPCKPGCISLQVCVYMCVCVCVPSFSETRGSLPSGYSFQVIIHAERNSALSAHYTLSSLSLSCFVQISFNTLLHFTHTLTECPVTLFYTFLLLLCIPPPFNSTAGGAWLGIIQSWWNNLIT